MISRPVAFLLFLFCLGPIVSAQTTIHDLVMWDYRGTSPSHKPLPDYHEWLLEYCKTNTPERLVLYVSSPCIDTDFETFYDPEATASTAMRTGSTICDVYCSVLSVRSHRSAAG